MDNIKERAELFGKYLCKELQGAIVSHGYSQAEVAKGIGRQRANLSRWLNASPVIPIAVAHEICELIGMDLQTIVDRAERRTIEEIGPYGTDSEPQDETRQYTDEQREAIVNAKIDRLDLTLAAMTDNNKRAEAETFIE